MTSMEAGNKGGLATSVGPGDSVGEENAELCVKARDGDEKKAKIRRERDLFKGLFTDLTDEQRSLVEASMRKAAEKDGEKERVANRMFGG